MGGTDESGKDETLETLFQCARDGDPDAWERLERLLQAALFKAAVRVLKATVRVLDPFSTRIDVADIAADVVQVAMVNIFRSRDMWTPGRARLETAAIARNAAIDFLRKRRPEIVMNIPLDPTDVKGGDGGDGKAAGTLRKYPAIDAFALAIEHRTDLAFCLGKLPEALRTAVLLRYIEDLNLREIAERLGCAISTAKHRVDRGLEELRTCLSAKLPVRIEMLQENVAPVEASPQLIKEAGNGKN